MENDNITFLIDDNENDNDDETNKNNQALDDIMMMTNDLDMELNFQNKYYQDMTLSKIINYNINYNVSDLLVICDYYGISKNLKATKANKQKIIETLVFFENDVANESIVIKRQTMWFYMNELKNDAFMKKYVILWK
jgi:hypothetical protein